jgi:HSP20 family molecular chaperone IbpA
MYENQRRCGNRNSFAGIDKNVEVNVEKVCSPLVARVIKNTKSKKKLLPQRNSQWFVHRQVPLPVAVDENAVQASFEDGVSKLRVQGIRNRQRK